MPGRTLLRALLCAGVVAAAAAAHQGDLYAADPARVGPTPGRLSILATAEAEALAVGEAGLRDTMLAMVAQGQAKMGDVNAARRTLGQISGDSVALALRAVADLLAKEGDPQTARAMLISARDASAGIASPERRDDVLWQIATSQASNGNLDDADGTARLIVAPQAQAHAAHQLAIALAQAGDLRSALDRAQAIADASWRGRAFEEIAGYLAAAGDLPAARNAAASAGRWQGEALVKVAKGHARAGHAAEAFAIAEGIKKSSLRGLALRTVAAEQASRDLPGAIDSLRGMVSRTDQGLAGPALGRHLRDVADIQIRLGDLAGAAMTADALAALSVREQGEDDGNRLVDLLCKLAVAQHGRGLSPVEALDRARSHVENLDAPDRNESLARLTRAYVEIGDVPAALEIASGLWDVKPLTSRPRRHKSGVLVQIASRQAADGDVSAARRTVAMIARSGHPRMADLAHSAIAKALMERGELAAALESAKAIRTVDVRISTLVHLASGPPAP